MFETVEAAPPDAILGLTAAFEADENPDKINLGVGVYCDGQGQTPVLAAVKEAERRLLSDEITKDYLPIDGSPEYGCAVRELLFGGGESLNAATVQTPGGTGALRVAGDLIHRLSPGASIWMSAPTWANHPKIFQAAGLQVETYPYFDSTLNALDFGPMRSAVEQIPSGHIALLHACCHNPTGVDLTVDQWKEIAGVLANRQVVPLLDFAYQGLGDGLTEDAGGVRTVASIVPEFLVASSFSKNFGVYKERVGALTIVSSTRDSADSILSHMKVCVRTNFSNPPAHGSAIVTQVLSDASLRQQWVAELDGMRHRINEMRRLFVATLKERGVERDFSFIERQRGMFSFSGLNEDQVARLRQDYSIYIVGSGRINVAGITKSNIDRLCTAIAAVI